MAEEFDNSGDTYELGDVSHFREAGSMAVADVQIKYRDEFAQFLDANLPKGASVARVRNGRAHFEFNIHITPGTSMAPFHRIIKAYSPTIEIETAQRGLTLVVPYVREFTIPKGDMLMTLVLGTMLCVATVALYVMLSGHAGSEFGRMLGRS